MDIVLYNNINSDFIIAENNLLRSMRPPLEEYNCGLRRGAFAARLKGIAADSVRRVRRLHLNVELGKFGVFRLIAARRCGILNTA